MANPVVNITDITAIIISDEPTKDVSDITFIVDKDIQQFEVRAVLLPGSIGLGQGLLVEKDDAIRCDETLVCDELLPCSEYFLALGNDQLADVTDDELTNGDGDYNISVYARDTEGNWSS